MQGIKLLWEGLSHDYSGVRKRKERQKEEEEEAMASSRNGYVGLLDTWKQRELWFLTRQNDRIIQCQKKMKKKKKNMMMVMVMDMQ